MLLISTLTLNNTLQHKVASHSGLKYWVTFIDDSGRFRVVYLMKKKSETFSYFKKFKAWAENQTGCTIKALREDKGGEYMSREFDDFCAEHGIVEVCCSKSV